jgi:hypothetical protein
LRSGDGSYIPRYVAPASEAGAVQRGTLRGDFIWASRARTLGEATQRWEEFLRLYAASGEYEDGYHAGRVADARCELAYIARLRGGADRAAKLLAQVRDDGFTCTPVRN